MSASLLMRNVPGSQQCGVKPASEGTGFHQGEECARHRPRRWAGLFAAGAPPFASSAPALAGVHPLHRSLSDLDYFPLG